jgi:glycosyltransferase involved in cell wall biosynthesis
MHIAIVTTYPPGTGSLNEYAYHFVNALLTKPEVTHVSLLVDRLPEGQHYPANTSRLSFHPCWRFNQVGSALRIVQAAKRLQPDVVLLNLQFATFGDRKIPAALGLAAPALLRAAGIPTVALLHNIMETVDLAQTGFTTNPLVETAIRTAGTLTTRLVLSADRVALTIPKYVEIIRHKYNADNALLAPHGTFDRLPEPTYTLPPGPKQIMAFGKFGTYKRVEALIEAFAMLSPDHDVELVIAGSDNPNAAGYLARMREQFGHIANVRYTGYVPEADVPRLFRRAAVVVFPYVTTTGSSGVLHQAGSFGKAVALPHIDDFTELITDEGYTGAFFQPGDPASLAAAIHGVLADDERRVAIGRQNYLASQGLPITEVVDWYLVHMEHLLAEGQSRQRFVLGTR